MWWGLYVVYNMHARAQKRNSATHPPGNRGKLCTYFSFCVCGWLSDSYRLYFKQRLKGENVTRWQARRNNPPQYLGKTLTHPPWGIHLESVDACARRCARILQALWISKRRRLFRGVPNCSPSWLFSVGLITRGRASYYIPRAWPLSYLEWF